MTRRSILAGLILLGVVVAAGWGSRQPSQGDSSPAMRTPSPLAVTVRRLELVDHITRQRQFTGTIKAARVSALSFERPGRVVALLVEEGAEVTEGQLLARVDVEQVVAQRQAVAAQLTQARARLAELVAGPRAETIAAARARVAGFEAQVSRLERRYDRSQNLIATGAVAREQFEANQFELEAAVAERDAAQKHLEELLVGTRTEQLDAQRAVVEELQARLRELSLNVEDGELRAPFAGRVAQRMLDEGTVVASGATVFRLVEDRQLEAWMGIPPAVGARLAIGSKHQISIGNRQVDATLLSLRPQLDPTTRLQNAIFRMDEADSDGIVPGRMARLSLSERIAAEGYLLPVDALLPGPRGLWNVFVVSDSQSTVEQRNVELLYTLGEQALVTGTLRPGDAIVTEGTHRVVTGQHVVAVASNEEYAR